MSVKVRIAPSPTGYLHVGNIFVAMINWLFTRRRDGQFLLRLDDTDIERSTAEFARAIDEDLKWLGLTWDQFARQTDRDESYHRAVDRLKQSGRLYPCYETAEELALMRKSLLQRGLPPVYDRAALQLSDAERASLEAQGRKPHWRFRLLPETVTWDDLVKGPQHIDETSQSDPVLVRADGTYLYTLPSVVDDIEFGITHVIRGADHITNTAAQIQLFRALGAVEPQFGHVPLLLGAEGEGLSKRTGSLAIRDLRAMGLEPMAILSYLAALGTGHAPQPVADLQRLIQADDVIAGLRGISTPRFDMKDLRHVNARLLHQMPFDAMAEKLRARGVANIDASLWEAARGNIETLDDVKEWIEVCYGSVVPDIDDDEMIRQAASLLPAEPWNESTWSQWTGLVAKETGRKGAALFKPLRRAVTGRDHGPEMRQLLPLIGRAKAERRLHGERA